MRRSRIAWWGLALVVFATACSGNGGSNPGGDGGTGGTNKDLALIRQKRSLPPFDEPEGLRNLEVFIDGTRTPVTRKTSLADSVCQTRCVLTADRSRLIYVKELPQRGLFSAPVTNLTPDFNQEVQLNEAGKPLSQPAFRLIPQSNRVLFLQQESSGGAVDGGVAPPTQTLSSVSAAGGAVTKYRNGPYLPNSPFAPSADGSKVILGETLGAASQLNLWTFNTGGGGELLLFRFMQEGSAEFGGEIMELSPNGQEVFMVTQATGDKIVAKVKTDATTLDPVKRRIGPVECANASPGEICLIQSPLFFSSDGGRIFFLGGRQVGTRLESQLYVLNSDLQSAPRPVSSFTTEIHSLSINRARNRVIWATEASDIKRNNAIWGQDLNGEQLVGQPQIIVDESGLGSHFQEGYFLE